MPKDTKPQFYVYVLRDPCPGKNNQPIYVGKGQGDRAHHHWRYDASRRSNQILSRTLNKIRKTGLELLVDIVRYFDSEDDAFRYEIELIAQYGRRDLKLGCLLNRTDGGEGSSGHPTTEKARKARSENAKKLQANPKFAEANLERLQKRNADPEFIKAKRNRLREFHTNPEFAAANSERARTAMQLLNTNPKISKAASDRRKAFNSDPATAKRTKERWADPAYRARMSKAFSDAWIKRRLRKEK